MVAGDDRALKIETDPPPFAISVRLEGDVAASVVCEELDMAPAAYIRENLEPFRDRVRAAAFDLVGMAFSDLTGLRSLGYTTKKGGTGVPIRNPSPAVGRLLGLVELEELI